MKQIVCTHIEQLKKMFRAPGPCSYGVAGGGV